MLLDKNKAMKNILRVTSEEEELKTPSEVWRKEVAEDRKKSQVLKTRKILDRSSGKFFTYIDGYKTAPSDNPAFDKDWELAMRFRKK